MKGVVLAGGKGTRLHPITTIINKHLLPVGKYPMIYWSLFKLKEANITEVLILTNKEHLSAFIQLLGDGRQFGLNLSYKIQDGANGIADALSYTEAFVADERFICMLGDNLFKDPLTPYINNFKQQKLGARVLLKKVNDPRRFGIATLDKKKQKIISMAEKPLFTEPSYCITGIYFYDNTVFDCIRKIKPSKRGELEITDVNEMYLNKEQLLFDVLEGWWVDAGTHESLFEVNCLVHEKGETKID